MILISFVIFYFYISFDYGRTKLIFLYAYCIPSILLHWLSLAHFRGSNPTCAQFWTVKLQKVTSCGIQLYSFWLSFSFSQNLMSGFQAQYLNKCRRIQTATSELIVFSTQFKVFNNEKVLSTARALHFSSFSLIQLQKRNWCSYRNVPPRKVKLRGHGSLCKIH